MAKDGTNRGGRRVRAGGKPYALVDKIAAGKSANVLDISEFEIDEQFDGYEQHILKSEIYDKICVAEKINKGNLLDGETVIIELSEK